MLVRVFDGGWLIFCCAGGRGPARHVLFSAEIFNRSSPRCATVATTAHDSGNAGLHRGQKILLVSDHHARAAQSHPGDERLGFEVILMHDVAANQRPRATQTRPAVDSHCLSAADVIVCQVHKLPNNRILRTAAVWELHLVDLNPLSLKLARVVQLVVEPDDTLHL